MTARLYPYGPIIPMLDKSGKPVMETGPDGKPRQRMVQMHYTRKQIKAMVNAEKRKKDGK